MSDELKPCPFCGISLAHIESMARSFDPPRIYHEYRHPKNGCFMATGDRRYVAYFTDNPTPRLKFIKDWNQRAKSAPGPETRRVLDSIASALGERGDDPREVVVLAVTLDRAGRAAFLAEREGE